MYTYIHTYIHKYVCVCVCMCVCECVCAYAYIHMYVNIYIYVKVFISRSLFTSQLKPTTTSLSNIWHLPEDAKNGMGWIRLIGSLKLQVLQNIVSFVGLFCKKDL